MKLTYIITTYNRPEMLEHAVQCVARERCDDSELIVVDDNSEPPAQMPAFAAKWFPQAHQLIRNPANLGVIGARNAGIAAAQGQYLVFLDDDDESLPNRTKDLLALIEPSTFDFVAACSEMTSTKQTVIVPSKSNFRLTPEKLLLYPSHINAIVWRKEMLNRVGGLDNRVPYLGEHISLLLCLLHGGNGWLSEPVVARFEYKEAGLTQGVQQQNRLKAHLIAMYQILLQESETPAFCQLCEQVLAMLNRENIQDFDAYLQFMEPLVRRYRP